MASAAAVGANVPLSPEPSSLAEPNFEVGNVTSAVIPPDEPVPDMLGEDDDDEEVVTNGRRKGGKIADEEEDMASAAADLDADLFGDDDEEPAPYATGQKQLT